MGDWDFLDSFESGSRPTQRAWQHFFQAEDLAGAAARKDPEKDGSVKNILYYMALSLANIAIGLKNLSVGLRATYILLEQVNKKLGK
ncbi:MAG TPA: hypothetical protein VGJ02_02150 [Pyrinomonadaceae bacterium]